VSDATPIDDRGRFTLKSEYRKILGGRIVQVLTPDGVLLLPVPKDLPAGSLPPSLDIDGDALYEADQKAAKRTARRKKTGRA
jgi:hypothetical protein